MMSGILGCLFRLADITQSHADCRGPAKELFRMGLDVSSLTNVITFIVGHMFLPLQIPSLFTQRQTSGLNHASTGCASLSVHCCSCSRCAAVFLSQNTVSKLVSLPMEIDLIGLGEHQRILGTHDPSTFALQRRGHRVPLAMSQNKKLPLRQTLAAIEAAATKNPPQVFEKNGRSGLPTNSLLEQEDWMGCEQPHVPPFTEE